MKKRKQNGFILVAIIGVLAVVGTGMYVLIGGSNALLFQSNSAYLQACEANLRASGLAWAKKNIKAGDEEIFDKSIELNVSEMKMGRVSLTVNVSRPANKRPEVQIQSSCSRGRQTISRDRYR
jgi:type II secretory pathway pseudopilin PulG